MSAPDIVVISGAGRGLGRALALRCGAAGLPVLCLAQSPTAHATRDEIRRSGGQADSVVVDLADVESTLRTLREWIEGTHFQRVAVVAAAGTLGERGGLLDGSLTDWDRTFRVNVLGNLAVVQAVLPRMIQAGYGRIVTFAGGGAAYAYPLFSGYALSKTAMVRATENLDAELKGKGDFNTVCIAPGAMQTDMLAAVRAAGAEVRTTVPIEEPVEFVWQFICAEKCAFSGRFVHVRDTWKDWLGDGPMAGERWRLRRIEQ